MVDIKTKSRIIATLWISYVILLMVYYKKMVEMVANGGFSTSVLIYVLSNPAYLVLIYYIIKTSKNSKIRATFASLLIIISLDMVTSPRVLVSELFTTGTTAIMNSGTIAIKAMMGMGFNAQLAWYMYYLILPIIFFLLAMELLGVVDFVKKIGNGGV